MTRGKIKLGVKVLGGSLFDALFNSEYMKEQKYKVLYSEDCETKRETVKKDGVEYKTEELIEKGSYTIIYQREHKRFEGTPRIEIYGIKPGKKISKLKFWISSTIPESTISDLENLVKELNQKFCKK